MVITAKKRFEILKKWKFRCSYCWKNWKDVTLEIDHIIPKSKWWKDTLDNLCVCCRECNIGKWNNEIVDNDKTIKYRIKDLIQKSKDIFYNKRNNIYHLWEIDHKTVYLIAIFFSRHILWLDWDRYLENQCTSEYYEMDIRLYKAKVMEWWEYLDDIIENTILNTDLMCEEILYDIMSEWRNVKNKSYILNYLIWKTLYWKINNYVLEKYCIYFHEYINNGKN